MDPETQAGVPSVCVVCAVNCKVITMPRPYSPLFLFSCLASILILPTFVLAHLIEIPAGKKECFFEDLHVHDKVSVFRCVHKVFLPDSSYNLDDCDISGWRWRPPRYRLLGSHFPLSIRSLSHHTIQLSDPTGKVLGKQIRQSTGQIAITAEKDGRHEYCFSNQMSAIADKTVRCVQLFLFCFQHLLLQTASMSMVSSTFLEMVCPASSADVADINAVLCRRCCPH